MKRIQIATSIICFNSLRYNQFLFDIFYQTYVYTVNTDIAESGLDRPGQGPWPTPESAENAGKRGERRKISLGLPGEPRAGARGLSGPIPPVYAPSIGAVGLTVASAYRLFRSTRSGRFRLRRIAHWATASLAPLLTFIIKTHWSLFRMKNEK